MASWLGVVAVVASGVRAAEPSAAASRPASAAKVGRVYLVQHTHTDIGYTRPQSEILPEHLRFIDEALDCCDRTDSYPDDAQFRWTCESSWVVREYLRRRPASRIERFKKRVAEGRVEVGAMALNMSEIATESSLTASLRTILALKDEYGIPVRLAMQDDVNGAAWCLTDYFPDCGVRYLTMGINKTRSLLPFDMPTPFWWESPSGKRVLAFRAEHYMAGNTLHVHEGDLAKFEKALLRYLDSLEQKGYPFDRVLLQYSGFPTDNSFPSAVACDLIRKWNETHDRPKLRSATASEFMDDIATRYGESLAVYRTAWPDWWTDGFGSAARETAQSRATHAGMRTTQALLAMALLNGQALPAGVMDRVAAVQEGLLFYDEHTFGAANSISEPSSESTVVQWDQKAAYVWEAVKQAGMLREEAFDLLRPAFPKMDGPMLVAVNPLNWERTGPTRVTFDRRAWPPDRAARFVDVRTGEQAPAQKVSTGHMAAEWIVWTKDVPALGYRSYRMEPVEVVDSKKAAVSTHALDGAYYTLTLDPATGAIASLMDKAAGVDLVDKSSPWRLGQIIHERHEKGRELQRDAFRRTTVRNVKIQAGVDGPLWSSITAQADLDGCAEPGSVRVEIRLYKLEKKIELHFGMRKLPVTEPEAVYVAFPFQWRDGRVFYEAQGGTVEPGVTQLPGSSSDWHTVQNFLAVRGANGQILLSSDEAPLVQIGDLNLGKWQPIAKVEKPHVYSWVMNNYWYTNFRATQEGEFRWSYCLTSTDDGANGAASRFGWGSRVPLTARVLLPGEGGASRPTGSMLGSVASNLLLVEVRPTFDGSGVILHLREVDGKPAEIDLADRPFGSSVAEVDEVNVLEQSLRNGVSAFAFEPYEAKFIRPALK